METSRTARSSASGLTGDLAAVWPEVEVRLRRVLAARRVPRGDWDDLLQEVALRSLASGVAFATADDLSPWASRVLRNAHVDSVRRQSHVEPWSEPVDPIDLREPGRCVEARLDLSEVARVMATWSDEDRAVVLGGRAAPAPSNAVYVRRHRLRARLQAAIDAVGLIFIAVWRRLRTSNAVVDVQLAAAQLALVIPLAFVAASAPTAPASDATSSSIEGSRARTEATTSRGDPKERWHDARTAVRDEPGPLRQRAALDRARIPYRHAEVATPVGRSAVVEVDDNDGDEPLFCLVGAPIEDRCIEDPPIFSTLPQP